MRIDIQRHYYLNTLGRLIAYNSPPRGVAAFPYIIFCILYTEDSTDKTVPHIYYTYRLLISSYHTYVLALKLNTVPAR